MVHAQKVRKYSFLFPALLLIISSAASAQDQPQQEQDPPSRVARLNYLSGNVSMEPAGVDDWAPAELNRPFTIGDYLYADQGGMAELHLDVGVIRIGSQTSFGFLNLDDRTVQIKLTEGDMSITVRHFDSSQVFEVDTPNAAINLLRDGTYRFRVDPNGSMSFVVVHSGQAEVTGGGQAFTLNPDNSATLNGTDQLSYDIELAPQPDEFDNWCSERDQQEAHLEAARYVSPTMIGYEDLDQYGSWGQAPDYGPVWYPTSVQPGWAPYQVGHWAWIDPWGWTWVDSMPWGFAPFHYGRWVYAGARWGWCPGPMGGPGFGGPAPRPWYAPAMVAWFGGAHWGVGISIGGGPSLGWLPLGFGEVYTPAYHCSPRYFNNVNVYNTRVTNVNITNVYNTVYVNKTVYNQTYVNARAPNAVMAMPQSAFAGGRPVQGVARPISAAQFAQVRQAAVTAPPVAPTRQSFLGAPTGRAAAQPPSSVMRQQVVARSTPPAQPAPFAARQSYLQQHAATGQPLNIPQMRQAVAAERVRPNVRTVAASTPVAVRPGVSHGTPVATRAAEPAAQPHVGTSGPAQEPRPSQPTQAQRPSQATGAERPAPTQHGVPPNIRQQQEGNQPTANERNNNDRYNNSAERNNTNERSNTNERTQQPTAQQRQEQQQQEQEQRRSNQPARTNDTYPTVREQPRTQPTNNNERNNERPATRNEPTPRSEPSEKQAQPERRSYPAKSAEPREEHSAPSHSEPHSSSKEKDHKGR